MALAQDFCRRANTAIASAEHLAAAALAVAGETVAGLPAPAALEAAPRTVQAEGEDAPSQNVMWGSSARDAITATAARVREAGGGPIDARTLAYVAIASGEVSPMFLDALGTTRAELLRVLARE